MVTDTVMPRGMHYGGRAGTEAGATGDGRGEG